LTKVYFEDPEIEVKLLDAGLIYVHKETGAYAKMEVDYAIKILRRIFREHGIPEKWKNIRK
jgi:hypothetical protein